METAEAQFSDNAIEVLRDRYLRREPNGELAETPTGMLARVARAVAQPARLFGEDSKYWEARFFERMRRLEFLPNSPTLMNAGLPPGQLAACFVLPIDDDLDSIFAALNRMARIHQSGGGTGFSFSRLRPRDDRVRSTGGISSGPLTFMDLFDQATAVIRQGGRRRGANMAVLRVDHPDIEEFIRAKTMPGRLENFNLSVGITEEFWQAQDGNGSFALRNPRNSEIVRRIDARALFQEIVEAAWANGDPGLLFLDEVNKHNPTPALGVIETTNPCGEQPLLPYESCTLGSLNLSKFVAGGNLDRGKLAAAIYDAVVFLDNVIEASHFPFPEIETATRRTRKIGLGIMGLADFFARAGVAYDSEEALALGEQIAKFLADQAWAASSELGKRRGSFPAFHDSVWPSRGIPTLRNSAVTCIAPTGTISLLAGTSSAIEPFFALALERHILGVKRLIEINPVLEAHLRALGPRGETALRHVEQFGTLPDLPQVPQELRRRFSTALEMAPEWHVRMQAAFQAHMDAAVSKTVNLPETAKAGAVDAIFKLAHHLHLKGVTVYRYGSRAGQTLSLPGAEQDCRECAV
jgi:ribonucleoside-diphosphate reductase alpha chain